MRLALDSRAERQLYETWDGPAVEGDEVTPRVLGKDPTAEPRASLTGPSHTLDHAADIRRLRRTIAAVMAGMVLLVAPAAHADEMRDHPRVARCLGIDWRRNATQTAHLDRCIARSFDAPGTPAYAAGIARCESGFRWWLRGSYVGQYQHAASRWHGRWEKWGRAVAVPSSPTNAISAAVVSARMARVTTWSPWSCA